MWTYIKSLFSSAFKSIVSVTGAYLKKESLAIINNAQYQKLALEAVSSVMDESLTSDQKRKQATAKFKELLNSIGVTLKDNAINTLIELVLYSAKNTTKE